MPAAKRPSPRGTANQSPSAYGRFTLRGDIRESGVEVHGVPNSERSGGRTFDRRHGVTTHAVMFLSQLDATRTSEAYAHATHYEAVPVKELRAMLASLPDGVVATSTFVDVGAGMGRAVMIASEYPFKQVVGIELSPALFEIARENLARAHDLSTRCRDVRLVRGDARRRRFPGGTLAVFLFNPFDGDALRETIERIRRRARPATPSTCSITRPFIARCSRSSRRDAGRSAVRHRRAAAVRLAG